MKRAANSLFGFCAVLVSFTPGSAAARCPLDDFSQVCLQNTSMQELLAWASSNGWKIQWPVSETAADGFLKIQSPDGFVFVSDFVDFGQVIHMECATTLELPSGSRETIDAEGSKQKGHKVVNAPPAWGAPPLQCVDMKEQLKSILPADSSVVSETDFAVKMRGKLDGTLLIVVGSQVSENASHTTFTATKIIFKEGS